MRRHRSVAIALAQGLVLVVAVLAAHGPLRRLAWAELHSPDRLASLPLDARVKFEPGAEEVAAAVAAILPQAIGAVEQAHGRPFRQVAVYVLASPQSFAAYGAGTARMRGTTWGGRTFISPRVTVPPATVAGIVTHELSHAHLQQWLSGFQYLKVPSWFHEGLATYVSHGGGAEAVPDDEARAAIARGNRFSPAVDSVPIFPRTVSVAGVEPRLAYPLAYRQASLFIAFLVDRDPARLAHLVTMLIGGTAFADAFRETFGQSVDAAWQQFVSR